MNLENVKKLINDVMDNEFKHIQETQEYEDSITNDEINIRSKKVNELIEKLLEAASEHTKLIEEFENEFSFYLVEISRYYFKKGVVAGTTNLEFLKDTNVMECI